MIKTFIVVGFLFSLKTVVDSGQFKKIEPHFDGDCQAIYGLEGPEDIIVINDTKAIISADPRRTLSKEKASLYSYENKDINSAQGSLFLYDLVNNDLLNLTNDINFEFHPHGISSYTDSNDQLFISVVNHTSIGHYIDMFKFENNNLEHISKLTDDLLLSPNDIVMISKNQFYITNDHRSKRFFGKMIEDYLQLSKSNLVFYDGDKFKIVVDDLQYANGVNISHDKSEVYIAETIGKKISVYGRDNSNNKLALKKTIDINSGLDNIEIDKEGNLWVGSHPKLFDFVRHAKNIDNLSSSQVFRVSIKDYSVSEIYLNNGQSLSGSSVAAFNNNHLLIGAVFENKFLHCFLND